MKSKFLKIASSIPIISFLITSYNKKREKKELRRRILADGQDYTTTAKNIRNSISKSKVLYKKLIVKVHPDRFLDDRKTIATELCSKITKSKKNYDDLVKLEQEVNSFLQNKR